MSQPPPELTIRIKPSSYNGESATVKTEADDTATATATTSSTAKNQVEISINNVVSSFSTRCRLNLRTIAMAGMHVEFKKENNMVNMRLRRPLTTASIWQSGKITCTGATTEPDAYRASRRYCRILQRMKFKVRLSNYRVVNVLATCAMPFAVDIYRVAGAYQKECSYEPELHPGATYKIRDLHATLKLFNTGSITLTAPSVSKIEQAIRAIYPILYEFRREQPGATTDSSSSLKTPTSITATPVLTTIKSSLITNGHNNGGANIAYAVQTCSREFKTESYTTTATSGFAAAANHVNHMMTGGMAATTINSNSNNLGFNNPLPAQHSSINGSFPYDHLHFNSNPSYNNNNMYSSHSFNMFDAQASSMMSAGNGFDFNNGYANISQTGFSGMNGSLSGTSGGSMSSVSLFGGVGSGGVATATAPGSASQPYGWFNDTAALAVDNMFEDFLP
jgi:TATA-box binding protein (TBP) (component of TFIID and TFIIIB)